MGLAPSPELAEELMVVRDLSLLKYTNSKLHISTISTEKALKNILSTDNMKKNVFGALHKPIIQ